LDSICFVLGITNLSQVRAGNLSELVYKQGQAGVQKAVVTLVFANDDPAQAPIGYESCPTLTVTRQVWLGGKSQYWINGKKASASQVQNLFCSVQLNVNNPHFLIMQGRITKVLHMRPAEILGLLEEAAGTRLYESKKKYSLQTITKKQLKLDELNTILNERITPTLERLRGEKQSYLQWSKNQADLERLERFCVAADYHRAVHALATSAGVEQTQALVQAEEAVAETQQVLQSKEADIANFTARLKGDYEEAHQVAKEVEDTESKQLVKATASWQNAKSTLAKAQSDYQTTQQVHQQATDSLAQQQVQSDEEAGSLHSLQDAAQQAQTRAEQLATDLQNWSAGVATSADDTDVGSLPEQMAAAHADAQTAQAKVQQGEMRIQHLSKELKSVDQKLKKQTKSAARLQLQETKAVDKVTTLQGKLEQLGFNAEDYQALDQSHVDLSALVDDLTSSVDTLSAQLQGRLSFAYKDPVRGFDRSKVKGLIAKLVTAIPDAKYATALEVVAGGRLYQVVVDEAITGKALLERGQLVRRVTIIPLDKIRARQVPVAACAKASEIASQHEVESHPAIELIGFDESVRQAMEYVFGSSLVVDSGTAANAVCNTTKTRTVTLDGDVYDPSGTIAGGSKNNLGTTLAQLTELRQAQADLAQRQTELAHVTAQRDGLQANATQYEKLTAQLDLADAELATIRKNLSQTSFGMLSDQQKAMQAEEQELRQECAAMQQVYTEKMALYERLQSQKEELTQQREVRGAKMQQDLEEAKHEAATQTQLAREVSLLMGLSFISFGLACSFLTIVIVPIHRLSPNRKRFPSSSKVWKPRLRRRLKQSRSPTRQSRTPVGKKRNCRFKSPVCVRPMKKQRQSASRLRKK
jgi:structural maintenance of chromosome 2